ncbi:MAG: alpha/beta fold hydrolase [Leptodesmis sp.]|uniref:alpha/beta fold hydrolase n=1 Tax=Leptodesmis sp. TaxID=3100501 RepID=UPI003D0A0129
MNNPNHHAYDLRGNGRSQGRRGHLHRWAEFREDLRHVLHWVQEQQPGYPCFLLGHSLGSVITLGYGLHYPAEAQWLQGVIAIAPALGQVGVSPIKIALGRMLSGIWPQFSLPTSWDRSTSFPGSGICRHGNSGSPPPFLGECPVIHGILCHRRLDPVPCSRLASTIVDPPGEDDRVVSPESSRTFFQHVTLPDKEWQSYPEGYHELHNDLCAAALFADLESWLTRHLPS